MEMKEELQRKIARLRNHLGRIEDTERAAEARKLLGKCYRYRNSYGSSRPGWWLYLKVTKTTGDGRIILHVFEATSSKTLSIRREEFWPGHIDGGYVPITQREFAAAWKAFVRKVTDMKP